MFSLNFFLFFECFLALISETHQTHTSSHQSHQSHQSYWDFDDVETVQLFARDGADGDYYGRGMAICGDKIVIGSSLDTFKGVQSGTAYIYSRGGATAEWNIIGKLFPSIGDDDDHFGWSVACYHNYTIVGAYGDDNYYENGGAVYLFTETDGKYVEEGIFYPSGQDKNENFGWSVAIHGNLVVIGAKGNSELYTQCGAVYIFRKIDSTDGTIIGNGDDDDDYYVPSGWVLDDILVPPSQFPYMNYGWSVSLYRNTLVISAPRAEYSTGYVYVYMRNTTYDNYDDDQYYSGQAIGYELVSILQSPDPQVKSYFGQSVSIYEDLIVVGQYLRVVEVTGKEMNGGGDDDSSYELTAGGAYVYQKNTISKIGRERSRSKYLQQWGAIADLGSLVGYHDYEMFGYSVAVFHDLIAIGAPGDSVVGINSSVYIFASDESTQFQTWIPITSGWGEFTSDRQKGKLGSSLALSEGLVLVGDPECYNENSVQTGCAYSWWGVNRKGHGEDETPPPGELLLSETYEPLWISFTVILSVALCCLFVVLLHRYQKRETVDVVLEDMMMSGDSQRMPYSSSDHSLGSSIGSFSSSHLSDWLHRYSDNTNDWLFGGNEMKPVSSPSSSSSPLSPS
jgi:hypothetical protein